MVYVQTSGCMKYSSFAKKDTDTEHNRTHRVYHLKCGICYMLWEILLPTSLGQDYEQSILNSLLLDSLAQRGSRRPPMTMTTTVRSTRTGIPTGHELASASHPLFTYESGCSSVGRRLSISDGKQTDQTDSGRSMRFFNILPPPSPPHTHSSFFMLPISEVSRFQFRLTSVLLLIRLIRE
jgi:hypothetical protein